MTADTILRQELQQRWQRCRSLLQQHLPGAEGLLVFSRLNIYYLSGTSGNGLFWLPMDGEPVLLCRRGLERADLESQVKNIFPFQTYRDIADRLGSAGCPLPKKFAVEMNGISWALAGSFTKHLSGYQFVGGDKILLMARGSKSAWELERLQQAGLRHDRCLRKLVPPRLHADMNEFVISHIVTDTFFSEGHHGLLRMGSPGDEIYLGHIAAGDSGNYPSVFNGPVGLRGVHPAVPHMGSSSKIWRRAEPLIIDTGFSFQGYQTDKTQVYWLGARNSIPATIQKAHDFCIQVQQWIAENLSPGVLPSDLWTHSLSWAEKSGWAEGFMGLGSNKVAFAGHGIGLAIDEYPVLAKGFDLPLEEGMVLAVEPKIGIADVGMVGVENTFVVTAQGGRSLTGERYDIICIDR